MVPIRSSAQSATGCNSTTPSPVKSSPKELIGEVADGAGTGMTWKPSKAACYAVEITGGQNFGEVQLRDQELMTQGKNLSMQGYSSSEQGCCGEE